MSFVTFQIMSGEVFTVNTYNGFTMGALVDRILVALNADTNEYIESTRIRLYDCRYELVDHEQTFDYYLQSGDHFHVVIQDSDDYDYYQDFEERYEMEQE